MPRPRKYTQEVLAPLVASVSSIRALISLLGIKETGGNYRLLAHRISEYGLDTQHFTGCGWSRGKTRITDARVNRISEKIGKPDAELLTLGKTHVEGVRLKNALIRAGASYTCQADGCPVGSTWKGSPLTLHVDHINGNAKDNRRENLRFLCPNCHQQTETWGNKTRGRGETG